MDEPLFREPAAHSMVPDGDLKTITVFLAGTLEAEGRFGQCVVRSIAPQRVVFETALQLEANDAVRVCLTDNRRLWGEVEQCDNRLVSLRLTRIPRWIEDLYGRWFSAQRPAA